MRVTHLAGTTLLLLAYSVAVSAEPCVEDKAFQSTCDGSEQRYVVVFPPGERRNAYPDALVALHGHGSDRWQFARDARDECRAARDAAARHGMLYLSPDYRAKTSWMGPQAEADVVDLLQEAKETYGVRRFFFCGGSMGGTACLIFAVRHPECVAGAASMNGTANMLEYTGFQDAIAQSYGGGKDTHPEEYRNRSAGLFADRLVMPVGITAGRQDTVVPPDSVLRLGAALQEMGRKVKIIVREDGGHSTSYEDATAILEYVIGEAKASTPDR